MDKELVIRDVTSQYMRLRSSLNTGPQIFDCNNDNVVINFKFDEVENVPIWEKISTVIKEEIQCIKQKINELDMLYKKNYTFKIGKDVNNFKEESNQIMNMFIMCEQNIKNIDCDKTILVNLKQKLMNDLSNLYKEFIRCKSKYCVEREKIINKRQDLKIVGNIQTIEQVYETKELKENRELREILSEIQDLEEYFIDFHMIVLKQGTMLDRIDKHIENSTERVSSKILKDASYNQNKTHISLLILLILLILTLVLIFVKLLYKYFS